MKATEKVSDGSKRDTRLGTEPASGRMAEDAGFFMCWNYKRKRVYLLLQVKKLSEIIRSDI